MLIENCKLLTHHVFGTLVGDEQIFPKPSVKVALTSLATVVRNMMNGLDRVLWLLCNIDCMVMVSDRPLDTGQMLALDDKM